VVASAAGSLDRTEPIGCDTIGVDYKSATIKIDGVRSRVWAETDTAKKLAVMDGGLPAGDSGARHRGRRAKRSPATGRRSTSRRTAIQAGRVLRVLGTDALYILEADPQ
jgi:hypothetical protein